ncbi:metallophosphoesterase [Curvibacter sp. APW13]|uniref:metallophosphoesterase family protein n=1 Tax=Curvibacter sp. APW13 TaxID=3077236 RepID=UPI0028DEAE22|nr:metallophosphoesterase [Curvibacter sp. APW13]MDT8990197.1 metallophosphoesterase [Curvibacter sp. APW13]
MRIIHLSDTHIGRDDNLRRMQALLNDMRQHCNPQTHVLVHTGDLINHGHSSEMMVGRDLLQGMADAGWRVLLAPGNHDYGDSLHVDPEWAAQYRQTLAPFLFGDTPATFPVLRLVEDCAFIGLDSNAAEMGWWERWMAEGYLGGAQRARLSAMLDSAEVRTRTVIVYLHHHPFIDAPMVRADVGDRAYWKELFGWNTRRFRRLKDAYSLMQCLRDRTDILLFGHQHFGLDFSAEAQRYGIPLALDASSSTATQMDTDRMRYRIIDSTTRTFETRFVAFP